jgi:hypothetical protein
MERGGNVRDGVRGRETIILDAPSRRRRQRLPLSMTAQVEPFGMIDSVSSPTGDTRLRGR